MFLWLFLLFTALPALELYLLFSVGQKIGVLDTLAVIIVTGVVGAYMAKTQGRLLWSSINEKLARGEVPGDVALEGFLIFIGGVLLITPGFVTDGFGFLMVFPLSRKALVVFLKRMFLKGIQSGRFHIQKTHVVHNWPEGDFREEKVVRDVSEVNVIEASRTETKYNPNK